ncbi:MAG: hypothetical protein NT176_09060 [Proteobacteria bacterium]|nr:hypothetical protein [Pseudomonadota bacterium]
MSSAKDHKSKGAFATQKLNSKKVVPLPSLLSGSGKTKPVRGADLFPEPYANVGVIGRKKSGKTLAIRHIIQDRVTPGTVIYAFSASVHKDREWLNIAGDCKKSKNPFIPYTSLGTMGKESHLTAILGDMKTEKVAEKQPESDSDDSSESDCEDGSAMVSATAKTKCGKKKKKPRKKVEKYSPLDRIFIFDDMSEELNHPDIQSLLKTNRHWRSMCLVSTQYVGGKNGATTDGTRQFDYWMLFPNLNSTNLATIANRAGIAMELPDFERLYHQATAKEHNFLWVDVVNVAFRQNFDTKLVVPQLEHHAK